MRFKTGTRDADLSLARNICIHENHDLNLRFEAFSAADHPNWHSPGSDARSHYRCGVITSARTMRQLQMHLNYFRCAY
jgi:hypothetical protein